MMRDLKNSLKLTKILTPAVRTADANGAGVDLQGYGSCMLMGILGAAGDTLSGSVKIEFEVEHSDDNSTFTDCADTDILDAVTGTNTGCFAVVDASGEADTVYKTSYVGGKRYVRVVANVTGTHSTGTPSSVYAVLGHPLAAPVA